MDIPFWSENKPNIKEILSPINSTNWEDLTVDEKERIWKYLEYFFFDSEPSQIKAYFNRVSCDYIFHGNDIYENDHLAKIVSTSISLLNNKCKKHSFARNFLEYGTYDNACLDFNYIFLNQSKDVVFELLTIFSNIMVIKDKEIIQKKYDEGEEDFEKRVEEEKWKRFDKFSKEISEVFGQFGINYKLTRAGIVPSDEPAVIEKIYEPVLKKLSNKKWAEVNRDLRDAFKDLGKDDIKSGSGAITHALAALQGFLQILVNGKIGKGNTSDLIKEAINKKIIPDDDFSKSIVGNISSFWAKERQAKGNPHPKKEYAKKNEAKLVVSLVMVFVDYIL